LIFKRKNKNPERKIIDATSEKKLEFGFTSEYEIQIILKQDSKWNKKFHLKCIFDTGADISFVPCRIKEKLKIPTEFKMPVKGISPSKDCKIIVDVGRLKFKIIDDTGSVSSAFDAWCGFYPFKKGPTLLGMKSVLDKIGFHQDPNDDKLILTVP